VSSRTLWLLVGDEADLLGGGDAAELDREAAATGTSKARLIRA
jgi:hypothetical protein